MQFSAAAQNHTQSLSTAVDNKLNSLGWVRVWLMRLTLNSTVHIFFQEYIKSVFKTHFLTYRTPARLRTNEGKKMHHQTNLRRFLAVIDGWRTAFEHFTFSFILLPNFLTLATLLTNKEILLNSHDAFFDTMSK